MESFGKVLLILTVLFGALSLDVNGAARPLEAQNEVVKPNPYGGLTPFAPSPGFPGGPIDRGIGCGIGLGIECPIGPIFGPGGGICTPELCGPRGVPGSVGAPSPSISGS